MYIKVFMLMDMYVGIKMYVIIYGCYAGERLPWQELY